jgi:Amt family ammonium transporter
VKGIFGYDDSLDAFGVHGIGGTIGALLTGVFASYAINPIFGKDTPVGWIDGHPHQLVNQLIAVGVSWSMAIVGTLIVLKVVDVTLGLRVSAESEVAGLDISQHGEEGYYWEASAL